MRKNYSFVILPSDRLNVILYMPNINPWGLIVNVLLLLNVVRLLILLTVQFAGLDELVSFKEGNVKSLV